jgi:hypothetical protein
VALPGTPANPLVHLPTNRSAGSASDVTGSRAVRIRATAAVASLMPARADQRWRVPVQRDGGTDRSTLAPRSRRPTRVQGRCSVPRRALLTGSSVGNGEAKRVQLSSPHWACWNGDKANPRTVYNQSLPGVTGLRLPRSLRRAAARRRPRQTSGAGNERCTCRRFARIGQSSSELDAMIQDARFP